MSDVLSGSILDHLGQLSGIYNGNGRNHEGEDFKAELHLEPVFGVGLELRFKAWSAKELLHEERTWLAPDLLEETIALWSMSTNTPGVLRFDLREDKWDDARSRILVFGFGNPKETDSFREQIVLEVYKDGGLGYHFSWGLPGEPFGPKSQARLFKLN